MFWQVVEEPKNLKLDEADKKDEGDERKGRAQFFPSRSAFWDPVRRAEDKRWQQPIVCRSVPHSHAGEDLMKDEKWTEETVTNKDSGVEERQGKRHLCALEDVSLRSRLVPEASSLPANPTWEFCSASNHLFRYTLSHDPRNTH